jgi:WD40 repeat protein
MVFARARKVYSRQDSPYRLLVASAAPVSAIVEHLTSRKWRRFVVRWTRFGRWLLAMLVASAAFLAARRTLPCKPRVEIPIDGELFDLAFAPDGCVLASETRDGDWPANSFRVRLWNCKTARGYANLLQTDAPTNSLAFSRDGRHVAALTPEGDCTVWDAADGVAASRTKIDSTPVGEPLAGYATYAPDGRLFVVQFDSGDGFRLRDGTTGEQVATSVPGGGIPFHRGTIAGIDTRLTDFMDIFDFASDCRLATLPLGMFRECPMEYAATADVLACYQSDTDQFVVWDVASGRIRTIKTAPFPKINNEPVIGVSADGKLVMLGTSDGFPPDEEIGQSIVDRLRGWLGGNPLSRLESEIRLYDVLDGRERARLPGVRGFFSPDGKTLAVVSHEYRPSSNERITRLDLYDLPLRGPFGVCFSLGAATGAFILLSTGCLLRRRAAG